MDADDHLLSISGIQHYAFCSRQWALIHLDQVWVDNGLTADGQRFHQRAHNGPLRERRGDVSEVRGLYVHSETLGLKGICDVVEFHRSPQGCPLFGVDGLWQPVPIEYKRGTSKISDADRLQLCAQALCLEEMLGCDIAQGYLYYGQTHARESVLFDSDLREKLLATIDEMRKLEERNWVPRVRRHKGCASCSIVERCMPDRARQMTVKAYTNQLLEAETSCGAC